MMVCPEIALATPVQGICQIPLTKGFIALIDAEDYERVSAHKWRAVVSSEKRTVYAIGYSGEGEHRFRREAERRSGVKLNSSRSEATLV